MAKKELLDKELTYHEACDLLADAWLEAEEKTKVYPSREFRIEMFKLFEKFVEEYER